MNCDIGNFEKTSSYINEVKKSILKFLTPISMNLRHIFKLFTMIKKQ